MEKIFGTGSFVYEPFNRETSDIDITTTRTNGKKIKKLLTELKIVVNDQTKESPGYEGFSFKIKNLPVIQIIIAEDKKDLESWGIATEIMKEKNTITDKQKRKNTFIKIRNKIKEGLI